MACQQTEQTLNPKLNLICKKQNKNKHFYDLKTSVILDREKYELVTSSLSQNAFLFTVVEKLQKLKCCQWQGCHTTLSRTRRFSGHVMCLLSNRTQLLVTMNKILYTEKETKANELETSLKFTII